MYSPGLSSPPNIVAISALCGGPALHPVHLIWPGRVTCVSAGLTASARRADNPTGSAASNETSSNCRRPGNSRVSSATIRSVILNALQVWRGKACAQVFRAHGGELGRREPLKATYEIAVADRPIGR